MTSREVALERRLLGSRKSEADDHGSSRRLMLDAARATTKLNITASKLKRIETLYRERLEGKRSDSVTG